MVSEGYLEECPVQSGFGSTVDLTDEGHHWLHKAVRSDDCTMLLSANHELLSLDRDQTRPELTLTARFVSQVILLCVCLFLGGTAAAAPPPSGLATLPSVGAVP